MIEMRLNRHIAANRGRGYGRSRFAEIENNNERHQPVEYRCRALLAGKLIECISSHRIGEAALQELCRAPVIRC